MYRCAITMLSLFPLLLAPARAGARSTDDKPMIEDDLDTKVQLFKKGPFTLQMGGMIQVQAAFYVGDDAALRLHDPADTEGFRVRRARFGFGGTLFEDWTFYLAADLKDALYAAMGKDYGNEILDARITWCRFPWLAVSAGINKVPYSVLALQSSSRLELIERPVTVQTIAPDRRVGVTLSGAALGLEYAAGLYNGSTSVTSGNQMGGLATGVRVQYNILGKPRAFVPGPLRIAVGGGFMYDQLPSVDAVRAAGNLDVRFFRARLQGEFLWEHTVTDERPGSSAVEKGDTSRWGVVGELSAFVWRELVQLAFRYEYLKDNERLSTLGEQQLFVGGVNVYLYRHRLKMQANYIHRREVEGKPWENDVAFAQIQATF